jgi:hypothetical protein
MMAQQTRKTRIYTEEDMENTIVALRNLAPRANGYYEAGEATYLGAPEGTFLAAFYYVNRNGSDACHADGTRISPASSSCGTLAIAIHRAVENNIDLIDKIERRDWFTVSGSRKARYPREKSPALVS